MQGQKMTKKILLKKRGGMQNDQIAQPFKKWKNRTQVTKWEKKKQKQKGKEK